MHLQDAYREYFFTAVLALPAAATAFAVLGLGLFAAVRERWSHISRVFLLVTALAACWLGCFSVMYAAREASSAFVWAKAAYLGVTLLPAALYHFAVLVLDSYPRDKRRVAGAWLVSGVLLVLILSTDVLFSDLYHHPWGFYPRFTWQSVPLVLAFLSLMALTLGRYRAEYRAAPAGSLRRARVRSLLSAFAISYAALLDFVPAFGVPLYPFGYAAILVFVVIAGRVVWRYRLEEMTPRYAANTIVDTMSEALLILDRDGIVLFANRAAGRLFGPDQQLTGRRIDAVMPCPQLADGLDRLLRTGAVMECTIARGAPDEAIHLLLSATVKHERADHPAIVVCAAQDITNWKKAVTELEQERDRLQTYLDIAGVMFVAIDLDQRVTLINKRGCEILGCGAEEIIGHNWFDRFIPAPGRDEVRRMFDRIVSGRTTPYDYTENAVVTRGGEERLIAWHNTLLRDRRGAVTGTLSSGTDITERKRAEDHARTLAYYDSLTGLPNRTLYRELLSHALIDAQRSGQKMALLFVDIDFFKRINDTLGHDAGDALLKSVAERLVSSVRRSDYISRGDENGMDDVVSRLGGDEFIIMLKGIARGEDAARVAQRVLEGLAAPVTVANRELFVSASIGISLYPSDGADVETLLKNADVAMYHAKDCGRNNYQFYAHSMNIMALERLTMEGELRRALERNEFVLHYQPTVDANTRRIVGVEALVRWLHPDRGLVSPGTFIPIAEESGLIVPLGEWVLRTACREIRTMAPAADAPISVAVNISNRQFVQEGIAQVVGRVLTETGFDPRLLELEITESTIMQNPDKAITILKDWKAAGIRIAVDDFGTGYSSLGQLRRLPVDALKIDRSFVRNITTSADDVAIARAIVAMAHSLKLHVIAEGVETEEQFALLRSLGSDEVQGYLFSKPVPAEEIERVAKALWTGAAALRA